MGILCVFTTHDQNVYTFVCTPHFHAPHLNAAQRVKKKLRNMCYKIHNFFQLDLNFIGPPFQDPLHVYLLNHRFKQWPSGNIVFREKS